MNNVLVVTVNWLGDTIFSTPVFRALKEAAPGGKVVCLAVPRVRAILEHCPYVDEVVEYDERGRHRGLLGKVGIIGELRRRKFDTAVLLHGSWTRALLVFLAGIPVRAGYDLKHRASLLTHALAVPADRMHRADYYFRIVEAVGVFLKDRSHVLQVKPASREYVRALLDESGITDADEVVVVNMGGNWDLKRWPAVQFARLVRRLNEETGAKVVFPGADKDRPRVEEVARLCGHRPIDLTGRTPLSDLLALLDRATVVVSADSGPLHMASAVGTPVVAVFGPTRPEITGPRGKASVRVLQKDVGCNKGPCYFLECPDNVCMQAVDADEVVEAVKQLLEKKADENT